MAELDARLFGYRILYPEAGGEARLANALLRLGISAKGRRDGGFLIREADFSLFSRYAGGRVRYTASEPLGLPPRVSALRFHIPVLISVIASLVLFFSLSGLVWDVRVDGAEQIREAEITSALREVGLSVGKLWRGIDPEETEVALLQQLGDLSWVQINRVGTVAYVTVRERAPGAPKRGSPYACSNIVAEFDGVIEEITVERGRAEVTVGQVVRRGDILISGVVETEAGAYLAAAKGSVRARVSSNTRAAVSEVESEEIVEEVGLASLSVEILGVKINIFKNYGNEADNCVIIDDEAEYLAVSGKRLPISVTRAYRYAPTLVSHAYTKEQMPEIAMSRLWDTLRRELVGLDLIKVQTRGSYTEGGYTLEMDYVVSREIGREVEVALSGVSPG